MLALNIAFAPVLALTTALVLAPFPMQTNFGSLLLLV